MSRALAFARRWFFPDVGGVIPYLVCLAGLTALDYFLNAPTLLAWLIGLMGWVTAIAWYKHWRGRA